MLLTRKKQQLLLLAQTWLCMLALAVVTQTVYASEPNPTVTLVERNAGGKGHAWLKDTLNPTFYGYAEDEYFVSGFTSAGEPYTSRIIVRWPQSEDARYKFNGTVVFEWYNVTSGKDLDGEYAWLRELMLTEGYAYVGVSAQAVGVAHMKTWDQGRYGALLHPGDDPGSFDIFAQAVQAVRSPVGIDVLHGLEVERVIASGLSQSSIRLTSFVNDDRYVNNGLIDGYILHSGGGRIHDVAGVAMPPVPVLRVNAEGEGINTRQEDSDTYRLWEEAGVSHVDNDSGIYYQATGSNSASVPETCHGVLDITVNQLHRRFVLEGALYRMNRWLKKGYEPPSLPRLTTVAGVIQRDEHGNALGGVRLPDITVPIAMHDNDAVAGCAVFFGRTVPFSKAKLDTLYPTNEDYIDAYEDALKDAIDDGYIWKESKDIMLQEAGSRLIGADL